MPLQASSNPGKGPLRRGMGKLMLCDHCFGSILSICRSKLSICPEKLAAVVLLTALLSWNYRKSWGWRILDFGVFALWWITFSSKAFTKAMTWQKGKNDFDRVLLWKNYTKNEMLKINGSRKLFLLLFIQHVCPIELNPWPCLPGTHKFIQPPTVCYFSVSQFPGWHNLNTGHRFWISALWADVAPLGMQKGEKI